MYLYFMCVNGKVWPLPKQPKASNIIISIMHAINFHYKHF